MNLSKPFIKRPVMTTLVMAVILFFGIMAYVNLPVSDMPDVDFPTIEVTVNYPGGSAELMANSVAAPLERQFTSLTDIQTITSTSNIGLTTIVLQFDLNRNIDEASTDVQAAITAALPNLPSDLPNNPTYKKVNPTSTPVLFYAVATNSTTLGKLYDYAYSFVGQRLGMVEGVSQIMTYGAPFAVRVQVDPDKLSGKEIGIDQLATTVQQGNPNLPLGVLYGPMLEYTVEADGQIFHADGYNNLIIRNNNGDMVRIGDVGHAIDSLQNDKYSLKYIDQDKTYDCVVLAVLKEAGANAVKVIDGVKELLPSLAEELPADVHIETIFDQSIWIFESIHDVEFTLLVAFLLVVVVVFFYLGKLIDTLIPICALPITIVGTFLAMYLFGFSLDILSLLALTLSIGFLVDDAIVVLENIARHVEMGKSPMEAALDGSKQISFTILSMTLCLGSVFIPLIFMGGIIGRVFREFALTIFTAVIISGIISLTLTPLLCSRFIAPHRSKEGNFVERLSNKINNGLLSLYKRGFHVVMRHKILTVFTGFLCLVGTLFLFVIIPKDFLPMDDLGFIQGFTQAPDGTSPYKMMDYQAEIEELVRKDPNVATFVSVGANPIDSQGLLFLNLKPIKERLPMAKVIPEMYAKFNELPSINTFLKPVPLINLQIGTQAAQGNYQYSLQSISSPEELYESAEKLIAKMKETEGFTQVSSDMHAGEPYVKINILRDRASDLNINAQALETALSLAYSGGRTSQINSTLNQYWVIVETIPSAYKDPSVLDKIYISSQVTSPIPSPSVIYNIPQGVQNPPPSDPGIVQVPLSAVTEWEITTGPLSINHLNTLTSVTITFDLDNIPLSTAITTLDGLSSDILPPGVSGTVQGSANIFKQSFADLNFLVLVCVFVIYVILGILYENFIHPITVMSALPPASIGALLTLLLFNYTLDLYSFVGIMMLIGIVLKNGIIMIDFANEKMHEGMGIEEAVTEACFARFRPIIMTTFAAGMGAVPIALGIGGMTAQSRRPLGLAIVGGLIFSQILTLFLTPVIFIYMERFRESFNRRFRKHSSDTNESL